MILISSILELELGTHVASVAQTGRECTGEIVGIDLANSGVGGTAQASGTHRLHEHSFTSTRHGFPQDVLEELVGY